MSVAYECPFFQRERNNKVRYIVCEVGCIRFADSAMRRDIVYKHCADPEGYKDCPFYCALKNYYERIQK